MLTSNSRYKGTPPFAAEGGALPAFRGLRPRTIPATPGIVEHTLTADERLDQLAFHYYNDDRLGWKILDANPQLLYGGELLPLKDELTADPQPRAGDIVLIPRGRST